MRAAIHSCRRFPVPNEIKPALVRSDTYYLSLCFARLDRPEALAALGNLVSDGWTRAMLKRAFLLLGWTARTSKIFADCVVRGVNEPEITPTFRRRLLVAGGLLGCEATIEAAERLLSEIVCCNASDNADADLRAAFLAVALVGADQARHFVDFAGRASLPSGLEQAVAKAARRLRGGYVLAISAP